MALKLQTVDQKHLESFKMCWKRTEISWTDHVRNTDVLHRVKEERNTLHTIKIGKVNWIGHIMRRNCLLKQDTDGQIEGGIKLTGRREEDVSSY
jgi:hypothetical protein